MTVMVRPDGKAKKIAFKILGKPANMQKTSAARKKINKRLLYEDTKRSRQKFGIPFHRECQQMGLYKCRNALGIP